MTLTSVIDGETLTRTVTGGLFTSFDTVSIFAPGTHGSFKFDDVNVSFISVPEPSNLAITSIGLLTLMGINLFRACQNKQFENTAKWFAAVEVIRPAKQIKTGGTKPRRKLEYWRNISTH
jgi:hypothetical protein